MINSYKIYRTEKEILAIIIKQEGICTQPEYIYCDTCPLLYWPGHVACDVHAIKEKYERALSLFFKSYNKQDLVEELI